MGRKTNAIVEVVDVVEAVSNTKLLDVVARCGFAVMAVLHVVIGSISIAVAFGQPGEAEPTGAIGQLAANAWGPVLMWAGLIGCAGLALWQFSEATLRARHLPNGERVGKLISSGFLSLAYGSVGLTFANFAVGIRGDSGESTQDLSVSLMRGPFGAPALIALGLIVLGIGVYFVVKGVRKGFKEELQHFDGTRRGRIIDSLGVTGHIAKGFALVLTGLLFVIAAVKNNPLESTGLDGSLKALRDHALGPYLLVAIGAGFIAYGAFALVRSKYGRM
jgi:Domain of Unknown Function (DUF1206)